jgi:hypothetical protein
VSGWGHGGAVDSLANEGPLQRELLYLSDTDCSCLEMWASGGHKF